MNSSKILCTICARGGSKGVKNKNIRDLLGKPLIAYTIESAKKTGLFDHIVLSTDSDEIAQISLKFGAEVIFKRPPDLATDTAAKLPVIRHAFVESQRFYSIEYDALVDLDATSPLRNVEDILGAWKVFSEGEYDNVITAMPSRRSPYFNLVEVNEKGRVFLSKQLANPIMRRQDSPKCFDMNASIYIWSKEALLNNDRIIDNNTGLFVMPENRSIDIDSELDFEFIEFLMDKREKNE